MVAVTSHAAQAVVVYGCLGQPTHEKLAQFLDHVFFPIFLGIGWPCILTFDGFNIILETFSYPTSTQSQWVHGTHLLLLDTVKHTRVVSPDTDTVEENS